MRILVAGDFCPKDRVVDIIDKQEASYIFESIVDYTKDCDYSIVNLECPTFDADLSPIKKCGPCLKTSPKAVDALKYAGFDCVTLANNHFRDYGDEGCRLTIDELNKHQIDYVGGGLNITEAQRILYKVFDNKKVAFVNFCENEFSIATETQGGAAPLDIIDNVRQITEARNNADYVVVVVHGGHEHFQYPSPRMKKTYRFFVDMGADVVVNHHQHCYSGYEVYNGKPIFYGLGNFCFDWEGKRKSIWNDGFLVILNFNDEEISFEIIPYIQCDDNPNVRLLNSTQKILFEKSLMQINEVIADDIKLKEKNDEYINSRRKQIVGLFSSYHNRYFNAAASRGWIPYMITKAEVANILNYVACEAHRDVVVSALTAELNQK